MTRKPAKAPPAKPALREPTAAELVAIKAARAVVENRPARPAVTAKVEDKTLQLGQPHSDGAGWTHQLLSVLGTASPAFADQSLMWLGLAAADGTKAATATQISASLAILAAVDPTDELEAAIGTQIVAAHFAALDFLNRARRNAGEYIETAAAYTNMASKASRMMAAHVDTLNRLRTGGKQHMTVTHVDVRGDAYVGDGGQAVFGGVDGQGGGGLCGKAGQPHALAYSPGEEVWSSNAERDAMRSPGGSRAASVSDARMRARIGSAEGQGQRSIPHRPAHPGASRGQGANPRRGGVGMASPVE